MLTCGVDIGSANVKAALLGEGSLIDTCIKASGRNPEAEADGMIETIADRNALSTKDIACVIFAGSGYVNSGFMERSITEAGAAALGAVFLFPSARTVIDIGAEKALVTRCDRAGTVINSVSSDGCAAFGGVFLEEMAQVMDIGTEELGSISRSSGHAAVIASQCTVLAKDEVSAMIMSGVALPEVVRAVHDSLARRITSLVDRVGIEEDVILTGGSAVNEGLAHSLGRILKNDVMVPDNAEFVSAIGAAVAAARWQRCGPGSRGRAENG